MPNLAWIAQQDALTQVALTVRAQAVSQDDNGRLAWPMFFPRANVDTTKINDINTLDYRPVADRREWNARGRLIPLKTPTTREINMIPIEARDKIEEQEINRLMQEVRGVQSIFQDVIGARIPTRVERLALSNYRRLEIDAFSVWTLGYITQREPEAGRTIQTSFNIDSSRLQTAGTAWNDGSLNAYNEFSSWYQDGLDTIGAAEGAMLRRATLNAILADAPTGVGGETLERGELERRLTQKFGTAFRFFVNEGSLDVFDDGGTAVTRTKVFPAEHVVMVPAGMQVGNAAFAPVVRAMELVQQAGEAGVDVNGNTVYYEANNGGRELDIECQLNAVPVPNESLIWGIDAGV